MKPILPTDSWLCRNDYSGLARAMDAKPELFKHILQETSPAAVRLALSLPPGNVVERAEKYAADNDGYMQSITWLRSNDHEVEVTYQRNPEQFAHIPQRPTAAQLKRDEKEVSLQQLVKAAEKYAAVCGGELPPLSRIRRSGPRGLGSAMARNPQTFAHIPRRAKRLPSKTIDDHRSTATLVAAENGGEIPHLQKLKRTHPDLYYAIVKHRSEFADFKIARKKTEPEQWVPQAEKLAKENGGQLPPSTWLDANGKRGLRNAINRHQHLFAHISRSKL